MPLPTRQELETRYGQMVAEQQQRDQALARQALEGAEGVGTGLINQVRGLYDFAGKGARFAQNYINDIAMMRDPNRNLPGYTQLADIGGRLADPETYRAIAQDYGQRGSTARGFGEIIGENINPLRVISALRGGMPNRMGMMADGSRAAETLPLEVEAATDRPFFNLENLTTQPERKVEIPRYEPPRGVPAYMQRLAGNQKAYDQVLEWAKKGMTDEGLGWYNTEELRKEFVKEFGEEVGQKNYEKYIDLVAATSAGAKTPTNAKIASYYYQQAIRGEPAIKPPKGSGYGHKAQNLHFKNAAEILEGGALDPIANPKRYTFGENLKGNWDYATVDKHNVRAFAIASKDPEFINTRLADPEGTPKPSWWNAKKYGEWNAEGFNPREFVQNNKVKWDSIPATWFKEAPTKTDYKAFEDLNRKLAKDLGVSPAAAQAALWLGAGERTGLGSPPVAFMKIMEGRLEATAKKRGITREQALKDFIRGNAPLLQMGGVAIGAGTLASQQDEGS